MSSSLFKAALSQTPDLLEIVKNHACGPGSTADYLKEKFKHYKGPRKPSLNIHLDFEEWWKFMQNPANN